MLTYPISRFVIEYLRNDEGVFFAGMTISQTISVVLFLGGCAYWAWLSTFPRELYRDQVAASERDEAMPLAAARS